VYIYLLMFGLIVVGVAAGILPPDDGPSPRAPEPEEPVPYPDAETPGRREI
jgi:hypothetical protein